MTIHLINGKPMDHKSDTKKLDDKILKVEDWWLKPTMQPKGKISQDIGTEGQPYQDYDYKCTDIRVIGTEKQISEYFDLMHSTYGLQIKDSWNITDDLSEEDMTQCIQYYGMNNKLCTVIKLNVSER